MNANEKSRAAVKPPTEFQIVTARRFVKHLRTGRENAKTARALAAEMQTEPRQIQQYAETARRIGYPVIASCDRFPHGYYLAESEQDVQEYSGRLHRRAGEIHKTRRELLRNLKHWNFKTQQHDEDFADEQTE